VVRKAGVPFAVDAKRLAIFSTGVFLAGLGFSVWFVQTTGTLGSIDPPNRIARTS
jgi:hypothetical protein